jgi:hypothetical protein
MIGHDDGSLDQRGHDIVRVDALLKQLLWRSSSLYYFRSLGHRLLFRRAFWSLQQCHAAPMLASLER